MNNCNINTSKLIYYNINPSVLVPKRMVYQPHLGWTPGILGYPGLCPTGEAPIQVPKSRRLSLNTRILIQMDRKRFGPLSQGKKWMYILWMIGDLRVQMDRYGQMIDTIRNG